MTTAREGKQFRKRVGKGTAAMNIRNFLDYGQDTRFRLTIFSSGTDFACEPRTSTNHIQSSPSCDPASLIFKPLPSCASGSVPIADLQHNAPLIVLLRQAEWPVQCQWSNHWFNHFLIFHTLDTTLYVYSILFQCPISIFFDKKPIIWSFPCFWRLSPLVTSVQTRAKAGFQIWQVSHSGHTGELGPAGRHSEPMHERKSLFCAQPLK